MAHRICVLALGLALMPAVAGAQSLGEIAKKEEARRKAVKASTKVYTNKDLGHPVAPPPRPPATPQTHAAPTPDPNAAQKAPGEVKDEAYWRARIGLARADLARNELLLEALQSRVNALSADFVNRDDPGQRAQIADSRQKALAELQRITTDIENGKKQIAEIEEEARRAGVPAGWLR